MNHLSEEQLIELYYDEQQPEAARHLDACSDCARDYRTLAGDLADMKPAHVPARDQSYPDQVWAAIADRLPPLVPQKRTWFRRPLWIGLAAAAACSMLIV